MLRGDLVLPMVGHLREGRQTDLHPRPGIADIERLGNEVSGPPPVEVELSGDLDDVSPSVASALYRLAQESITNAVRHARHATRVDVRIAGDGDRVRLVIADDGEPPATASSPRGYGLVGMTERATLLRMPELDGIEATCQLASPDVDDPVPVVVITTFDLDDYVHGALRAGARGFLLKGADAGLLVQAIHAAANGDALIAPRHHRPPAHRLRRRTDRLAPGPTDRTTHAPRGRGPDRRRPRSHQQRDRRRALHQPQHRQAHLASLMRKLEARNRVELSMWAHETRRIAN